MVWQVVHILTAVSRCAATVRRALHRRVVAVTFSGFAASADPVVPSTSPVGSFGRFDIREVCALASRLCRVVVIADDLRASLVSDLGFWFLGARATLALGVPDMSLLWGEVRGDT